MIILIISIILFNLMIWSSIILVAKWICLSCYMDLSKMFCVFLALCPWDFSLRESGKLELIWNVSTFPSHSLKVGIKHWKAFSNSIADSSKAACGDFPLFSLILLCVQGKNVKWEKSPFPWEERKISNSLRSEKTLDLQVFLWLGEKNRSVIYLFLCQREEISLWEREKGVVKG